MNFGLQKMGTPKAPLGGVRLGRCILQQRMEYESRNGSAPIIQAAKPLQETKSYFADGHSRE